MTDYTPQTWANGVLGGTPINAERLQHIETGILESEHGHVQIIYVDPLFGADGNSGLTKSHAKQSIAGAKSLLGTSRGTIFLLPGTHEISTPDINNNALTLDGEGQTLAASTQQDAQINITTPCTWGIKVAARQCIVKNLSVYISEDVTYGVGVSCAPGESVEGSEFHNVYCAYTTGTTGTANFALGPDHPGASNMDIAQCRFSHCTATSGELGNVTSGFLIGNGTAGNILQNSISDSQSSAAQYGITLAGSGVTWTAGGMSGIQDSTIHITQGGGDGVAFTGTRFEDSNRLVSAGYVGTTAGGVTLTGCTALNFNPTVDGTHIISWDAPSPLKLLGCTIQSVSANETISINASSSANKPSFTAISCMFSNANAYPGLDLAHYRRYILGAFTYIAGGVPAPNDAFSLVIDPGTLLASVYRSAVYSLVDSVSTPFPFDAETEDIGNFHSNTVNPERLTVPAGGDGHYIIGGTIASLAAINARFILDIRKNGTAIRGGRVEVDVASGTASPALHVSVMTNAVAGDYFDIAYYQNSGTTPQINDAMTGFWCVRQ